MDPQNLEKRIELKTKLINLAQHYLKDLYGMELYRDYMDVIASNKRTKLNGESMDYSDWVCQVHFINGIRGI